MPRLVEQRRLAAHADAFVVPSACALGRLRDLGAPVGDRVRVIGSVQRELAGSSAAVSGRYALVAGRLTPENGFADAIDAARAAGERVLAVARERFAPRWWRASWERSTTGWRRRRPAADALAADTSATLGCAAGLRRG